MAKYIQLLLEIIVITKLNVSVASVAPKELRLLAQLTFDEKENVLCNITIQKALEDINAFPDILQGYNLVYDYVDTQSCYDLSDSMKMEATEKLAFPYILIGGTCPYITEPLIEHLSRSSAQISYLATSPTLANRRRFPKLYRLTTPARLGSPIVKLLETFNWNRIAIIREKDSKTINDLLENLNTTKVSVIARYDLRYSDSPDLEYMKVNLLKDARIIIVSVKSITAAEIMCNAYKLGMYGKWFVWIFTDLLAEKYPFWYQYDMTCCSLEELGNAVEGAFLLHTVKHDPFEEMGIANITYSDLIADIRYRANVTKDNTLFNYAVDKCYDHVWVAALALNCSLNSIDELYDEPILINSRNMISDCIDKLDFVGTSGRIRFEEGSLNSLVALKRVKDANLGVVAYFRLDYQSNYRYEWIGGATIWKDNFIPPDSGLTIHKERTIPKSLYLTLCVLAAFGIIVSIACFVFSVVWKQNRIVKMSSPNINSILLIGCLLLHVTIIINTAATTTKAMCAVRLFCFYIGFATTFGSMLSKTWRVYKIFTNKHMKLNMPISDKHLLVIIGIIVALETLVLIVWVSYSPHRVLELQLEPEIVTTDSGERVILISFDRVCVSENSYYFIWTLRIMNGALIVFGTFLAWETRNVHIDALNDAKTIGICVYNVVILSAVELVLSVLLAYKPIELHVVTSVSHFAGTLVSEMLIFVPKMLDVYRNPIATRQAGFHLD